MAFSAAQNLGRSYIHGIFTEDGISTKSIADSTGIFSFAAYPVINNKGQVSFNGELKVDSAGNYNSGIYVGDGTSLATVADTITGQYNGFGLSSINNLGWVAFMGTDLPGGSGIYLWDGTTAARVIGAGDALFGSDVNQLRFSTQGLNDSGQIVFGADGRIVRADPVAQSVPEPSFPVLLGIGLFGVVGCGWMCGRK